MAGPDYTAVATGNTNNASAQALQNITQTGQSQSQAFSQAQQNDAAAKTAALKSAMAMAALRGAPQGNVTQAQDTIAAPLNDRAATLGTTANNYAENNAATKGAFASYFDLTKAGLPIAQQNYNTQAAGLQEKAAERQAALQAQVDAHNATIQAAQARAQAAADKAAAPRTPAQIIAALGGADLAGDAIGTAANQGLSAEEQQAQQNANNSAGTGPSGQGLGIYDQRADTPGAVGAALGLPAGTAEALVGNAGQRDATQAGTTTAIESSPAYQSAAKEAEASFAAGDNYETFAAKVAQNVQDPVIAGRLLSVYGGQFRTRDAAARAAASAASSGATPTTIARTQ